MCWVDMTWALEDVMNPCKKSWIKKTSMSNRVSQADRSSVPKRGGPSLHSASTSQVAQVASHEKIKSHTAQL